MANEDTTFGEGLATALGGFATGFASGYTGQDFLNPYLESLREKSRLNKRVQDQVSMVTGRLARDPESMDYLRSTFSGLNDTEIISLIGDYDSTAFSGFMNEWQSDQLVKGKNAEAWQEIHAEILGRIPALRNDPSLPPANAPLTAEQIAHWRGIIAADESNFKRSQNQYDALQDRLDLGLARVQDARGLQKKQEALNTLLAQAEGMSVQATGLTSDNQAQFQAYSAKIIQNAQRDLVDTELRSIETQTLSGDPAPFVERLTKGEIDWQDFPNLAVSLKNANPVLTSLRSNVTQELIERSSAPQDIKELVKVVRSNPDTTTWMEMLSTPALKENPNLLTSILNTSEADLEKYESQVGTVDQYNNAINSLGPLNELFGLEGENQFTGEDLSYIPAIDGYPAEYAVNSARVTDVFKALNIQQQKQILADFPGIFPDAIQKSLDRMYINNLTKNFEARGLDDAIDLAQNRATAEFDRVINPRNMSGGLQDPRSQFAQLLIPERTEKYTTPIRGMLGFGFGAQKEFSIEGTPREFYPYGRTSGARTARDLLFGTAEESRQKRKTFTDILERSENDTQALFDIAEEAKNYFFGWDARNFASAVTHLRTPKQRENFIRTGVLTRTPEEMRQLVQQSIAPTADVQELTAMEELMTQRINEYEALSPQGKASPMGISLELANREFARQYQEIKRNNDTGTVLAQLETIANIMSGGERGEALGSTEAFVQFKSLIGQAIQLPDIETATALEELPVQFEFLIDEDLDYRYKLNELIRLQGTQGFVGSPDPGVEEKHTVQFRVQKALQRLLELADSPSFESMTRDQAHNDMELFGEMVRQRFGIDVSYGEGWFDFMRELKPDEGRIKLLLTTLARTPK